MRSLESGSARHGDAAQHHHQKGQSQQRCGFKQSAQTMKPGRTQAPVDQSGDNEQASRRQTQIQRQEQTAPQPGWIQ